MKITADYAYFRLRDEGYPPDDIKRWADTIARETASCRDVFVYFKHEDEGKGPEFAQLLMEHLGIAVIATAFTFAFVVIVGDTVSEPFIIARTAAGDDVLFRPSLANRHGLITGATGTGKTVTLQVLAEHFSQHRRAGVPGGRQRRSVRASPPPARCRRSWRSGSKATGLEAPAFAASPVAFWDVFGKRGVPVRATISDLGPLLLGRLFKLNATQQGVLAARLQGRRRQRAAAARSERPARDAAVCRRQRVARSRPSTATFRRRRSARSSASLLEIEQQGGETFFGEPMLDVDDLLQTDGQGRGMVNVLAADELMRPPKLYATFLLWMLSELFERLPEVGDPDKPTLVFFFDEAHLLFTDAPPALIEKIEQVVRLIRSKGVGVYFVTQSPADIPDTVLGQLGNRVQHALRAFTPRDQKAVKTAAETLRPNPKLDIGSAITELAVGEALVSMLDAKGTPPSPSGRGSRRRLADRADYRRRARGRARADQSLYGHYEQTVDRESAYEKLGAGGAGRAGTAGQAGAAGRAGQAGSASPADPSTGSSITDTLSAILMGTTGPRGGHHDGLVQSAARSAARSVGSGLGRAILRGALGSILGGSTRSRR